MPTPGDRPDRPDRPNIVLIHGHDLGVHLGTYGLAGSSPSPVIDAFAARGIVFELAFCTAPVSSPARSSLFTGRYPHATGMHGPVTRGFGYSAGPATLPMYLSAVGYRTALAGVQEESDDPTTLGYDEVLPVGSGHCWDVARGAQAWIEDRVGRDEPFFLSAGFLEAQRPWGPERYVPDDPASVEVPEWLPDNVWTRDDLAQFHGAIRVADAAVGVILRSLRDQGFVDDTWVIFTTDNGPAFPGAQSTLYEPGVHVALIHRFPVAWNLPSGRVDCLVSQVDLVPTILARLGVHVSDGIQGISHAGWLSGRPGPARSEVFTEKTFHSHYDPMRGIRTDRYKLICSFEQRPRMVLPPGIERSATRFGYGDDHLGHRPPIELYDLSSDPYERHDVSGQLPEVTADLLERLTRWQRETGDPLLQGPIRPASRRR